DHIEKNLRTVAVNYHNEARKLGRGGGADKAFGFAEEAYRVYLAEFPESSHSYEMRYAFGELLYKLKKYDESYDQYMQVVKIDPKGKRSQFCANSAIHAAAKMIKVEQKSGKILSASVDNKTEPIPLSEWETKRITAIDQFIQMFPDHKDTKGLIYEAGNLYYTKNQFKEMSDRFRIVIGMDPRSKQAMLAANQILDSFVLIEDWPNLKEVSKSFYDQESLGNSTFKKEVYQIYERTSFKLIEIDFVEKEKFSEAAGAFMAFYDEFPESKVADKAINNASVYYYKTTQRDNAMKARHLLIEKFPKSEYYKDQVAALGYDYETIADFETSAEWYEKLFAMDKEHEGAKEALYSAGLFRRALGDSDKAVENFQKFMTIYPDDERSRDLPLDIGKIYESNEKWSDSSKVYYTYFTKADYETTPADQVFFARMRYGLNLEAMNQTSKADRHWVDTLKAYDAAKGKSIPMEAAIEFAAQIMFKQADPALKKYEALQISGPAVGQKVSKKKETEIIKSQLASKAKTLQEIEATYVEIIQTGAGEWGLACLVQLGKAYENMGEALGNSYIPPYLTDDQKDMYKMEMEDLIFPQEEKAVQAYSEALKKSFELNLYNDNTAFATRRLGELRPNQYPVLEELLLEPRYTTRDVVEFPYAD
ncbi:MAG: tetratricopeptide repeat protein, partial [Myxococcota bacterium]|nr:tetratricopeptide repeat protein [Myxococcota bacterium]